MISLEQLEKDWQTCNRCPLGCKAFKHVLHELPQNKRIQVLFIGEGPGRSEDTIGRPFIGRAGKFLRSVIEETNPLGASFGFSNLIACRPTDSQGKNRPPQESEIRACRDRLVSLIQILNPVCIVGLGRVPQQYIPEAIRKAKWGGGEVYYIRHPSYVIRHGGKSAECYENYCNEFREVFDYVMIGA